MLHWYLRESLCSPSDAAKKHGIHMKSDRSRMRYRSRACVAPRYPSSNSDARMVCMGYRTGVCTPQTSFVRYMRFIILQGTSVDPVAVTVPYKSFQGCILYGTGFFCRVPEVVQNLQKWRVLYQTSYRTHITAGTERTDL